MDKMRSSYIHVGRFPSLATAVENCDELSSDNRLSSSLRLLLSDVESFPSDFPNTAAAGRMSVLGRF